YVRLTVMDSGIGMDEVTQARIFEPFFTTKVSQGGSGLGLAGVFGIVKGLGGYIDVESTPGHGSTFRIFVPAVEQPAPIIVSTDYITSGTGNGQHILLVDDEVEILQTMHEFL